MAEEVKFLYLWILNEGFSVDYLLDVLSYSLGTGVSIGTDVCWANKHIKDFVESYAESKYDR